MLVDARRPVIVVGDEVSKSKAQQEVVSLSPVVQVPGKQQERFHLSARVTETTPETGDTE